MIKLGLKYICICVLCSITKIKTESEDGSQKLDEYKTFDQINEFLTRILQDNENVTSEIIIGQSVERRDIRGIRISTKNETEKSIAKKLAILVDGGIHAREWVSSVAVLYTIHQLLENTSNSYLIENADWYIFPLLNPDGYIFSMDPNGPPKKIVSNMTPWRVVVPAGRISNILIMKDRQWRKNRAINPLSDCRGVDLNRNFDFAWGGAGSSDNPCDWGYRGPHPFSEPEAKALADFISSKMPQIKMYLTLHSAAQAIVYPYGFTNERPPDWQELDKLARQATQEMFKINQTLYLVGPTTETVGIGAGGSDDWAKASAGIKYVYTMELPGLHYPLGGFHPPESALDIISRETFEGIKVFASYLINITQKTVDDRPAKSGSYPLQWSGLAASPAPHWYNPFRLFTFA